MSDDFIALSSDTDDYGIEKRQQEGPNNEALVLVAAEKAAPTASASAAVQVARAASDAAGAAQQLAGVAIEQPCGGKRSGGVPADARDADASTPLGLPPRPADDRMPEPDHGEGMAREQEPSAVPPAAAEVENTATNAAPNPGHEPAARTEAAAADAATAPGQGTLDANTQEEPASEAAIEAALAARAAGQDGEGRSAQPLQGEEATLDAAGEQQSRKQGLEVALPPTGMAPSAAGAAAAAVPTPTIAEEVLGPAPGHAGSGQASPPANAAPGPALAAAEDTPAEVPAAPGSGIGASPAEQTHSDGAAAFPLPVFEDKGQAAGGEHERGDASTTCSSRDPRLGIKEPATAGRDPRLAADQKAPAPAAPAAAAAGSTRQVAADQRRASRSRSAEASRGERSRGERGQGRGGTGRDPSRRSQSPGRAARERHDSGPSRRYSRPASLPSTHLSPSARGWQQHNPMAYRRPERRLEEQQPARPAHRPDWDQPERRSEGRGRRHEAAGGAWGRPWEGQEPAGFAGRRRPASRSPERADPRRRPPPPAVHFSRPHDEAPVGSGRSFDGPQQHGRPRFSPTEPPRQQGRPYGGPHSGPPQFQAAGDGPRLDAGFGAGSAAMRVQQGSLAPPAPGARLPGPPGPGAAPFQPQVPPPLQQQELGGPHYAPAPLGMSDGVPTFGSGSGHGYQAQGQAPGRSMGGSIGGSAYQPLQQQHVQPPQFEQQRSYQQSQPLPPQQQHSHPALGPPQYGRDSHAPQLAPLERRPQRVSRFGPPADAPPPLVYGSAPASQPGLPPAQRELDGREHVPPFSASHNPHPPRSHEPWAIHGATAGQYGAPPAHQAPAGRPPGFGPPEPAPPPHVAARQARPTAAAPGLEEQQIWFYQDPKGVVHGPHSIAQFRRWVDTLAQRPDMREDYLAFRNVSVFKQGGGAGVPLSVLLG